MEVKYEDDFLATVAGVLSQRGDQYLGDDKDGVGTQAKISKFWSEWLNLRYETFSGPVNGFTEGKVHLDATDVAAMMILLKLVRLAQGLDLNFFKEDLANQNWEVLKDSLIDIGGYASILYESVKRET